MSWLADETTSPPLLVLAPSEKKSKKSKKRKAKKATRASSKSFSQRPSSEKAEKKEKSSKKYDEVSFLGRRRKEKKQPIQLLAVKVFVLAHAADGRSVVQSPETFEMRSTDSARAVVDQIVASQSSKR